jgi:hypothetical protein
MYLVNRHRDHAFPLSVPSAEHRLDADIQNLLLVPSFLHATQPYFVCRDLSRRELCERRRVESGGDVKRRSRMLPLVNSSLAYIPRV